MNLAPVEWPLRFKQHNFGARCYDTLGCKVIYDNFDHGDEEPTSSSASRGRDYLRGWRGGYLGVNNFPKPAEVIWRSKDGMAHEAEIDIGEIFNDELIRHHVPHEEMADLPDGKYAIQPLHLVGGQQSHYPSVYERTYPPQEGGGDRRPYAQRSPL